MNYESEGAHVACNFIYFFEGEGLLKITGSHVHYTCGNTSIDRDILSTDR